MVWWGSSCIHVHVHVRSNGFSLQVLTPSLVRELQLSAMGTFSGEHGPLPVPPLAPPLSFVPPVYSTDHMQGNRFTRVA